MLNSYLQTRTANVTLKNELLTKYLKKSCAEAFMLGFIWQGQVYAMTVRPDELYTVIRHCDKKAGSDIYTPTFRPSKNNECARWVFANRAHVICSEADFKKLDGINNGMRFELAIAQYYNIEYQPELAPYWEKPDMIIAGIGVQLKFERGRFEV